MRVILGEDSYNQQKDFIVQLCRLAIECDCRIHIIHHNRKGDETKPSGRYDAKGPGVIADNVANSLIVWANKQAVPGMPQTLLVVDKQRLGKWEGGLALKLNHDSLTFSEC
ncbi:hypothetical protein [Methylophilus sp. 3sh_L]|uniref:hypothetical protein n=1 Tax=Methylophilus sp. 3sh_L TaxID=3377114 RepID=UPI00398F13BF